MIIFLSSGWLRKPTRKSPNHDMTSFGITILCVWLWEPTSATCHCGEVRMIDWGFHRVFIRVSVSGWKDLLYHALKGKVYHLLPRGEVTVRNDLIWISGRHRCVFIVDLLGRFCNLCKVMNWYFEERCLFWGETNVTRLRLNLCSSHFAPDFPQIFPT